MKLTLVVALASLAAAVPTVIKASTVETFGGSLSDSIKSHPDAYAAFQQADVYNILPNGQVSRRQAVPVDATPDPDRNVTTPENIFVLQCSDAGFRGECLVFGAAPGSCGMFSHFFFFLLLSPFPHCLWTIDARLFRGTLGHNGGE